MIECIMVDIDEVMVVTESSKPGVCRRSSRLSTIAKETPYRFCSVVSERRRKIEMSLFRSANLVHESRYREADESGMLLS